METINDNSDQIYLSGNLRFLRKRLNISQEELASRVGLNRGNIASYEKGTAEPKICNLLKLARLFRVSILDLTRRDLRNEPAHFSANGMNGASQMRNSEALKEHQQQIEELRTVVNSIYNCHQFHIKNQGPPTKELKLAASHIDQLHEVAQVLFNKHERLLRELQGDGKEEN